MNDDSPLQTKSDKIPSYYNPHNVVQDAKLNTTPLLIHEPPIENPKDALSRKYPIKVIAGALFVVITLISIPVALYLNQRPTRIFIEATATPHPTISPSPTPSPVPSGFTSEIN